MASDYQAIREDNVRRYGTDIGRIGPMLLANRYDDRTHFIYELLQNTEDALAKRIGRDGPRSVRFLLSDRDLHVRHFGKPFDEPDVRGICGIDESTKDLTAIGRFGIGFKSVYAFSDRPEVHSGNEDFAIESFVWPATAASVERAQDETVIVIPLRDPADGDEIAAGLQRLGPGALLFLREIEEIEWGVEGGLSGHYFRSQPDKLDDGVRRITVIAQAEGIDDVGQTWLVFSRPILTDAGKQAGYIEVAFQLTINEEHGPERVRSVSQSPLVVYFPTVVETHLGFLVQGPYRTTPSRDNVPHRDPWNQRCVKETANLLVGALQWLRNHDQLDVGTLRCLPLDPDQFGDGTMFAPVYGAVKHALTSERLLPRHRTGFAAATNAKMARTQELRDLVRPAQLKALFGVGINLTWLSGEISQDRTPELRQYLMRELDVAEVTPETFLATLQGSFLRAQNDEWVRKLYEFLNGQPALKRRAAELPLVRLTSGRHVQSHANGQPQAFLPGSVKTGFPTVRAAVCSSEAARAFLRDLGLTEPDPVDDVIRNVLPKYCNDQVDVSDRAYETDIGRILAAFATDSKGQREKLLAALRDTPFVRATEAATGTGSFAKPGMVYLATDRLRRLFDGVPGVQLVDDRYGCLRGEDVRALLEACEVTRHLRPVPCRSEFSWDQLRNMRIAAGCESTTGQEPIEDSTLEGLEALLDHFSSLELAAQQARAALLWEALDELEERRGTGVFSGSYSWFYYHRRSASFDAAFVRILNEQEWIPGAEGRLQRPESVLFDSLGWKPNPFLQSRIRFKPPLIDQLAKEAGIEPGVLELLKKLGVTSVAELRTRLGVKEEPAPEGTNGGGGVDDALRKLLGDKAEPTPPVPDPAGPEPARIGGAGGTGREGGASSGGNRTEGSGMHSDGHGHGKGAGQGSAKRLPEASAGRPFISYVSAYPDEEEPDPDGLEQQARMALEARAIDLILASEPNWQRTPALNPGFDLFEPGADGRPTRWVEVKAMTGGLRDRPVGLSRTQFECAQERGSAYWLYVVERAASDSARIVRVQDPAGKARTFTFDQGWLNVADVDKSEENQEG